MPKGLVRSRPSVGLGVTEVAPREQRPWWMYGRYEPVVKSMFPVSTPDEVLKWARRAARLYSGVPSTDNRTLPMKGKWPSRFYVGEYFLKVTDWWIPDPAERIAFSVMRFAARERKGWGRVHQGGYCYMSQRRLAMEQGISIYKVRRLMRELRARTYLPDGEETPLIVPIRRDIWNHRMYFVPAWKGLLADETYLMVPLWLLRRWDLGSHDKLVWACLRDNAQPIRNGVKNPYGAGHACLTQRQIADRVRITRGMVKDSLALLCDLRLAEYRGPARPGGPSVYRLLNHAWRQHYMAVSKQIDYEELEEESWEFREAMEGD